MSFLGFLLFSDPPKPGIEATIGRLRELGVSLKVITGDNALVAATVARADRARRAPRCCPGTS